MNEEKLILSYREQIAEVVKSYRWIVAIDILVAAFHFGKELTELGVEEILLLSAARGSGEMDDRFPFINLQVTGQNGIMEGIYAAEEAFQNLSADVLAQIDAFDPKRKAMVLRTIFGSPKPIAGRRVFGAREEIWCSLEDKIIVDQLWDDAGVSRMPSKVLLLSEDDLWEQVQEVDKGSGTV